MKITTMLSLVILSSAALFGQTLRMDSVSVDSVWNTDSTWTDFSGSQQRTSRDCLIHFLPVGRGTARCTVAVSFNGGTAWVRARDSGSVISTMPANLFPCGQKAAIRLRITGADRQNMAIRITGRQNKPEVDVTPSSVLVGSFTSNPAAGKDTTISIRCSITNTSLNHGSSPVAKVYWDLNGDGVYADSTDSLFHSWTSPASSGTSGERKFLFVKIRDANGLWSTPDTVVAAYGLRRKLTMAAIAAGTYSMGSNNGRDNEKPVHPVTLSAFNMMTTDITTEFFALILGRSPLASHDSGLTPALNLTWFDAALFCNAASQRAGLDTCYSYTDIRYNGVQCGYLGNIACDFQKNGYRLPTEAEWEYAARAGTTTTYYWGNTVDSSYCWYPGNSPNQTQPVGLKRPNAWGLYDMLGNVSQWVNDPFAAYTADAQTNPVGPDLTTSLHTQRGGNVFDDLVLGDAGFTCTIRDNGEAGLGYFYNGFRMVQK